MVWIVLDIILCCTLIGMIATLGVLNHKRQKQNERVLAEKQQELKILKEKSI